MKDWIVERITKVTQQGKSHIYKNTMFFDTEDEADMWVDEKIIDLERIGYKERYGCWVYEIDKSCNTLICFITYDRTLKPARRK